jgi:uncharacterized protein (DUF433 family)
MSVEVLPIDFVVSDPDLRGGRPVIAGTSLRISDLAVYHTLEGLSPDQLAVQFDLDLAQVHAGLSYYYIHKSEIDAEIRENAREASGWKNKLLAEGRGILL